MIAFEAIVSGLGYGILALLVGALMTASFVLPQGKPASLRRDLISLGLILLLAFLLVASISLLIQGAKIQRGDIPSLDTLSRYLLRTQSGKIWLAREVYAVLLALVTFWLLRWERDLTGARVLFFLSLPLVASRSLTSHAIAVKENTMLVVSADTLHLTATAFWAGGLPVLFWVLYQGTKRLNLPLSWAAETVGRFSKLALFSVGALVLTGLYQSWVHVQSFNALFGSSYGRVLLLKFSIFLGMVGLGALNFLSTRPRLIRAARSQTSEPTLQKETLKRIGAESSIGLMVLVLTGFLTVLPPGSHSLHLSSEHKAPAHSTSHLPVGKRLQSAEGARITILSPKNGQVFTGDWVPITYRFVKGKSGSHLHAYMDGKLMGMFGHPENVTLTGIKPGGHVLELRVATGDHITELDAIDRVDFVVK